MMPSCLCQYPDYLIIFVFAKFWHAAVQLCNASKSFTGFPEISAGEVKWEGSQNYQVTEMNT